MVLMALVTGLRDPALANGDRPSAIETRTASRAAHIDWRRRLYWIALAAVPSGLMLSTTSHLTTDLMAMPLIWVIPLGIYLLSFSVAFAEISDLPTGSAALRRWSWSCRRVCFHRLGQGGDQWLGRQPQHVVLRCGCVAQRNVPHATRCERAHRLLSDDVGRRRDRRIFLRDHCAIDFRLDMGTSDPDSCWQRFCCRRYRSFR